jgi:hypothetical protein
MTAKTVKGNIKKSLESGEFLLGNFKNLSNSKVEVVSRQPKIKTSLQIEVEIESHIIRFYTNLEHGFDYATKCV